MFNPLDHPLLILVASLAIFWIAAWLGGSFQKMKQELEGSDREEFQFVLGGTLTLLGLIIGFTFSMAVSRYDQRKNYEDARYDETKARLDSPAELPEREAQRHLPLVDLANRAQQKDSRSECDRNGVCPGRLVACGGCSKSAHAAQELSRSACTVLRDPER